MSIWRDERHAETGAAGDRHRFERVKRADEELRAAVSDGYDVRHRVRGPSRHRWRCSS